MIQDEAMYAVKDLEPDLLNAPEYDLFYHAPLYYPADPQLKFSNGELGTMYDVLAEDWVEGEEMRLTELMNNFTPRYFEISF